jgi:hypothetical protein
MYSYTVYSSETNFLYVTKSKELIVHSERIGIDREHYVKCSTLRACQVRHFLGASETQLGKETASFYVSSSAWQSALPAGRTWWNFVFGIFLFTKIWQHIIILVKVEQNEQTRPMKSNIILRFVFLKWRRTGFSVRFESKLWLAFEIERHFLLCEVRYLGEVYPLCSIINRIHIYRAFQNIVLDYKHLQQENQRTYINGNVHSYRKTEKSFFDN